MRKWGQRKLIYDHSKEILATEEKNESLLNP